MNDDENTEHDSPAVTPPQIVVLPVSGVPEKRSADDGLKPGSGQMTLPQPEKEWQCQ